MTAPSPRDWPAPQQRPTRRRDTTPVVVGVDVGGTSTRALVVDTCGNRISMATLGGGNPTSHQPRQWRAALSGALAQSLEQALLRSGPVEVRSIVAGIAGGGALADARLAASFDETVRAQVGQDCPIHLAGDIEIAFAAATACVDGTALVAGTGAIAAAIRGRRAIRTADGHGWLLGDDGSGFWLGREAVRATLADIEGNGPRTALRPLVSRALLDRSVGDGPAHQERAEIIRAVHARAPAELARLAPLVTQCVDDGDATAAQIARRAVGVLVRAVQAVRRPGDPSPLAVAGAVAAGDHAVGRLLRSQLGRRWPGTVTQVTDAVNGAGWLALMSLGDVDPATGQRIRRRLHAGGPSH